MLPIRPATSSTRGTSIGFRRFPANPLRAEVESALRNAVEPTGSLLTPFAACRQPVSPPSHQDEAKVSKSTEYAGGSGSSGGACNFAMEMPLGKRRGWNGPLHSQCDLASFEHPLGRPPALMQARYILGRTKLPTHTPRPALTAARCAFAYLPLEYRGVSNANPRATIQPPRSVPVKLQVATNRPLRPRSPMQLIGPPSKKARRAVADLVPQ
jgi:hypothetical protein